PGLGLTVDNATSSTPATFNWVVGSSHTVSLFSRQVATGTAYNFLNWTDGAAQNRTIIAPATGTTYTANYSTSYLLTSSVTPANGGSLTVQPSSPDGYYLSGTTVQLVPQPASEFAFNGWQGDATGTFGPLNLQMTGPHTVTGRFASSAT